MSGLPYVATWVVRRGAAGGIRAEQTQGAAEVTLATAAQDGKGSGSGLSMGESSIATEVVP